MTDNHTGIDTSAEAPPPDPMQLGEERKMDLQCHACGQKFRSMIAEAKHRHNFPLMCKRNKTFAAWEKQMAELEAAKKPPVKGEER